MKTVSYETLDLDKFNKESDADSYLSMPRLYARKQFSRLQKISQESDVYSSSTRLCKRKQHQNQLRIDKKRRQVNIDLYM